MKMKKKLVTECIGIIIILSFFTVTTCIMTIAVTSPTIALTSPNYRLKFLTQINWTYHDVDESARIALADSGELVVVANDLVYTYEDSFLKVYKPNTYETPYSNKPNYSHHYGPSKIYATAVDPNGTTIVFRFRSQLRCLEAPTGNLLWAKAMPVGMAICESDLYTNGSVIFNGGKDTLYCFNRSGGALIWEFNCTPLLSGVAIDDYDRYVIKHVEVAESADYLVSSFQYDIVGIGDYWHIFVLNKTTGEVIDHFKGENSELGLDLFDVDISEDGSTFAVAKAIAMYYPYGLQVFSIDKANVTLKFNCFPNTVIKRVRISRNGQYIGAVATGWPAYQNNLWVLNASGAPLLNISLINPITSFDMSRDGQLVLCGLDNGDVLLYNTSSSLLLLNVTLSNDRIIRVLFDRVGTTFAVLTKTGYIAIYQVQEQVTPGTEISGFTFQLLMITLITTVALLRKPKKVHISNK